MSHACRPAGRFAPKGRILVVDDDASLAEMLTIVLRQEGFDSRMCARGDLAMAEFRDYRPDLVLLDLMLPGKDGIDVCKEIRAESGVPIVMLTAKGDTVDVVVGLESGADDYVVKPFKPKELVARIRARVRRFDTPDAGVAGDRRPHASTSPATRSPAPATPISLTPLEFDLLVCLARKPWQVFTREVLLEQVWGYRHAADTRLVNVHVQRLRSKVEHDPENPEIVVTVRGVGYKAGNACRLTVAIRRPAPAQPPAGPAPRPHLLAPLDPGAGGGQHRACSRPSSSASSAGSCCSRPGTGLLDHRVAAVVAEAGNETRDARTRLAAASGTDLDSASQQRDLVEPIIAARRDPRLRRGARRPGRGERRPDRRRRRAVHAGPRHRPACRPRWRSTSPRPPPTAWTYTQHPQLDADAPTGRPAPRAVEPERPGSSSGSQVRLPVRRRDLHALLPLPARRGAARRSRWSPGRCSPRRCCCWCWSPGMTWLVTRQVVTPVRLARQVAERLAAGQLQERLQVSGEDDLARLATSFNQMASSLQRQIRQLEELSRVQRRFVSDVSHELRTPLTTVRMAGDVLHDARRGFDPVDRRGPPSCCRPSSTASRRCWPTCSRSAASTPAPRSWRSRTSTSSTSRTGSST